MFNKYALIAAVLVTAAAGRLFLDEESVESEVDGASLKFMEATSDLSADDQPIVNFKDISAGKAFELYDGIKTQLERLIFESNSRRIEVILAMAAPYCHEQGYQSASCEEFTSLYTRYVNYKYALVDVDEQYANISASTAEIEYQLLRIQRLQGEYFSREEQHILFSADNALDRQALVRRSINRDPNLSKQQKERLIMEHIEQLPEEQKRAFRPSLNMQKLAAIKNTHQDRQQRLLEVETEFGYEAAQRLDKRWRERESFKNNVKQIEAQYRAIANSDDIPLNQIKAQQQTLLAKHFSGNKLKRARVMIEQGLLEEE